jgi:molecular chaperone DnaK
MMRDAEAHAEEDKQRREEAETRNLAESLQYQTEKFLAESGDKIPADKKTELSDALGELRSALGGTDLEAIKSAQETVAKLSQDIGGAMYTQPDAEAPSAAGPTADAGAGATGPQAEDVVDAEIVDEPGEGGKK